MTKTAVVNVPRLEPHRPPPGPAIVCNVCAKQGHEVTAYDLNIEFFHYCRWKNLDYHGFDQVWNETSPPTEHQESHLDFFIDQWCQKISKENFDYVLLSIFGMSGNFFAEKFLRGIRPLTQSKIVAGGMGVGVTDLADKTRCYGEELKKLSLIDDFIVGEGEVALTRYFNGLDGPGINNTDLDQIENLDSLPWPDYSYYDLDRYDYLHAGEKEVYITGSRGCVRKCTYCDVEKYWPKYRYRTGHNIAQEIIYHYEQHGVQRFYFTDSLVNGSLKSFSDMCEQLSAYKFDPGISWSGQFIFRSKKSIPTDHFKMMKHAGADMLYVGIETGSDKVRAEMGKNFTNEDVDYQLEQCSQHKIKIIPLMFTGYVTETLQDHLDNLSCFARWQRYVADGTIVGVELGSPLLILPGSPVERMIESHGIEFMINHRNEPGAQLWWSRSNPDLTLKERIRRKLEVHETAIKYAWPVWRQAARLEELKNMIVLNHLDFEKPQQFYRLIPIENGKKSVVPATLQDPTSRK